MKLLQLFIVSALAPLLAGLYTTSLFAIPFGEIDSTLELQVTLGMVICLVLELHTCSSSPYINETILSATITPCSLRRDNPPQYPNEQHYSQTTQTEQNDDSKNLLPWTHSRQSISLIRVLMNSTECVRSIQCFLIHSLL